MSVAALLSVLFVVSFFLFYFNLFVFEIGSYVAHTDLQLTLAEADLEPLILLPPLPSAGIIVVLPHAGFFMSFSTAKSAALSCPRSEALLSPFFGDFCIVICWWYVVGAVQYLFQFTQLCFLGDNCTELNSQPFSFSKVK